MVSSTLALALFAAASSVVHALPPSVLVDPQHLPKPPHAPVMAGAPKANAPVAAPVSAPVSLPKVPKAPSTPLGKLPPRDDLQKRDGSIAVAGVDACVNVPHVVLRGVEEAPGPYHVLTHAELKVCNSSFHFDVIIRGWFSSLFRFDVGCRNRCRLSLHLPVCLFPFASVSPLISFPMLVLVDRWVTSAITRYILSLILHFLSIYLLIIIFLLLETLLWGPKPSRKSLPRVVYISRLLLNLASFIQATVGAAVDVRIGAGGAPQVRFVLSHSYGCLFIRVLN